MEDLFGAIFGTALVIAVLFIGFVYLPAFLSKITKTTMRTRGALNATYSPELFDSINDDIKEKSILLFNKLKSLSGNAIDGIKRSKIEAISNDKTKSTIDKLQQLQVLKDNQSITADEYNIIKDAMMKEAVKV